MEEQNFYLYGAAIQGIQSFILQSDELKDIVGASELVETICTDSFNEFTENSGEYVIKAAGNIKYVFDNRIACEKAVLEFPRKVKSEAPGVTVSQAVVSYKSTDNFGDVINVLESKLKAQRNKLISVEPSLMVMRKSRQTGLPVTSLEQKDRKVEFLDAGTIAKRVNAKKEKDNSTMMLSKKCFGLETLSNHQIAYDINKITDRNNWIAIIHADGNGLGQVVQKLGKDKDEFIAFSTQLDLATQASARKAFAVISDRFEFNKSKYIPIRPVVLGGDDLTIICRGDFAVEYTMEFLKAFEEETEKLLSDILGSKRVFKNGETKLTACAGIAFIKSSYPFYYGYQLAEDLCKVAKKDTKQSRLNDELAPSCLMYHKVQDSFFENYEQIVERELTPDDKITFKNGPYYLSNNTGSWTISELIDNVRLLGSDDSNQLKEANAVKSHLRQWLTDIYINKELAEQKLKRLKTGVEKNKTLKSLVETLTTGKRIAAYDVLSLNSIMFNQTR